MTVELCDGKKCFGMVYYILNKMKTESIEVLLRDSIQRRNDMNKKSGLILRIILGAYLIFLGVSLLSQMIQSRPSDFVLKSVIAIVFIIVGGMYAFGNIKAIYNMVKEETDEFSDNGADETRTKALDEKPNHDASIYRTAPMPNREEIRRGMVSKDTDLRENMKYLKEDHETAEEIERDYEEK